MQSWLQKRILGQLKSEKFLRNDITRLLAMTAKESQGVTKNPPAPTIKITLFFHLMTNYYLFWVNFKYLLTLIETFEMIQVAITDDHVPVPIAIKRSTKRKIVLNAFHFIHKIGCVSQVWIGMATTKVFLKLNKCYWSAIRGEISRCRILPKCSSSWRTLLRHQALLRICVQRKVQLLQMRDEIVWKIWFTKFF